MNTRETKSTVISVVTNGKPYRPKSSSDIYADLAESRKCYEDGNYEDFDDALNEISARYGL